jgi:hypothetical protein
VTDITAAQVADRLGLDSRYEPWLQLLDAAGEPPDRLPRPADEEINSVLRRLGCSPEAVADTVETWPDAARDPERSWLLRRSHRRLLSSLGDFDAPYGPWPQLPEALGATGSCFYLHLFVATLPATRAWHEAHGIPDDISWTTLADLGRHVAIHRRIHGTTGIDAPGWMMLHLRGGLYEIGRLQYAPLHFGRDGEWPPEADRAVLGDGFQDGDDALGVHIPAAGALDHDACEASYREAKVFFDTYFPTANKRVATCSSWLLDDQLADYLPADSNIVRFQRGFNLVAGGRDADEQVITFVFRNRGVSMEQAQTVLERAVVAHLKAGRHFRWRTGWRELEAGR